VIRVEGLRKRFGPLEVLKGVSFAIPQGGVTAVIGPSGGGKSTLLRCVNLLEEPDEGRLEVGGVALSFGAGARIHRDERLRLRRRTGMVFQSFQLFPHRTALRNVMEGLETVLGWKPDRARARALELLDRVGLPEKAESFPATLSGGQQQRVAIARALAMSPDVLLCDEPTSALDPELASEVVAVLRGLAADGMTMLMATHDLRLAAQLAREVLFLDGGSIVESGPSTAIFSRPAEVRTRAFVSSITGAQSTGAQSSAAPAQAAVAPPQGAGAPAQEANHADDR
jgi:L-cystine transport system ATP-binding protein